MLFHKYLLVKDLGMCDCTGPGFCPRHKIHKNQVLFEHCQRGEIISVDGKIIEPPNIIQKAGNFITASVVHMLNGSPEVDEETQKKRLDICEHCPLFRASERMCVPCGCNVDVKTKWADMSCPDTPPRWDSTVKGNPCKSCGNK